MARSVELIQRDDKRLEGVHPRLADAIRKALVAMDVLGFPMFVTQGVRSAEYQNTLFQQGRTTPGAIVTNLDGYEKKSNHQAKADGLGYAVDCAFVDDPDTERIETWDPKQPWELFGLMVEKLGMRWGGRWQRIVDRPHVEMPYNPDTQNT